MAIEETVSSDMNSLKPKQSTMDTSRDPVVMQLTITKRLEALRGGIRFRLALEGVGWLLGVALGLALLFLCLDWWLQISLGARRLLLAAGFVALVYVAWTRIWKACCLHLSLLDLAATLDRVSKVGANAAIAPRAATLLEFSTIPGDPQETSQELVAEAIRNSYAFLAPIDFTQRLCPDNLRKSMLTLLGLFLCAMVFFFALPNATSLWSARWFLGSNQAWPRNTSLEVVGLTDGRLMVPRGEPTMLRVRVRDKKSPTKAVWMRYAVADAASQTVSLTRFGVGDFRFELPGLQQGGQARLSGGDGRLGPFSLVPVDRPRVVAVNITHRHPRDTAPQELRASQAGGDLKFFPQTELRLEVEANVAVSEIRIKQEQSVPLVFERVNEHTFATSWIHQEPIRARIQFVSAEADLVSVPRPISIDVLADRPPRISLMHSGVRQRITNVATIPLKVSAKDDFGLSALSLRMRVDEQGGGTQSESSRDQENEGQTSPLYGPQTPATKRGIEESRDIQVASYHPAIGDLLLVSADAGDDCFEGAQTSTSRTIAFRIVPSEELFREILLRLQEMRARLRQTREQAEELELSLATAIFPESAQELLRKHRLLQREVWRSEHILEETVSEMKLNQLGGDEAVSLLSRDVVLPIRRLHDILMTRQRQAFESLAREEGEAVGDVVTRQHEIVASMANILENMAQWDSFIDVVNQLSAIIQIEKKVNKRTEALKEKHVEDIFQN